MQGLTVRQKACLLPGLLPSGPNLIVPAKFRLLSNLGLLAGCQLVIGNRCQS